MREILTDLIGKTVECYRSDWSTNSAHLRLRGVVRAAYVTEKDGPVIMVEASYGLDVHPGLTGYLTPFGLNDGVRVVEMCTRCGLWDHPSRMQALPTMVPETFQLVHRSDIQGGCR